MAKIRLDERLVNEGYFESRERAKRSIMAGDVLVDNVPVAKAGTFIKEESEIRLRGNLIPYVSRGGLKLASAIEKFNIDFKGKRVLDIGASTGGFTDCAIQNGASFVYALDVGTNQLAWKLRNHLQVKSIENCHIKDLTLEMIECVKVDIIVMDLSFISLTKVFVYLKSLLKNNGIIMALIKPQFEVGKERVEKNGIIKSPELHKFAVDSVVNFAKSLDFELIFIAESPILGGKGNKEFISLFK